MFKLLFCFLLLVCSLTNTEGIRKCYGVLGCFSTYSAPFNTLPSSRNAVGTKFTLQTQDLTEAKSLSANDVSNFNSAIPTKFIIHGFDESGSENWVIQMRRLLLIEGNYNVIIVDWEKGAKDRPYYKNLRFDYLHAVGNTRIVGAEIDLLITKLKSVYRISLSSVHLIGFSLGAHVAGFAGDRLDGEIGRITGLDPAGYGFDDEGAYRTLDRTDAVYVEVIHTDADYSGISDSVGHVDYYPNGGKDQPGCSTFLCDHRKAYEYYTASIKDQEQFSCQYYRKTYGKYCHQT